MAVYFKEFDKRRDWRQVVEGLTLTGASAIWSFNPVSLYTGIRDTSKETVPRPGVDELAGIWLRITRDQSASAAP